MAEPKAQGSSMSNLVTIFALLLLTLFPHSSAHNEDGESLPDELPNFDKGSEDTSASHPIILYDIEGYDHLYSRDKENEELIVGGGSVALWERKQNTHGIASGFKPLLRQLLNDQAQNLNIGFGELQYWLLSATEVFQGTANQTETTEPGGQTLYITINTCLQPQISSSLPRSQIPSLPQLQLYVSNTTANQSPGPDVKNKPQMTVNLAAGFGALTLSATGDVYIGVFAPNLTQATEKKFIGDWNYEVCFSTKAPYHGYEEKQNLFLIDSDNTAALLITGNMTTSSNPTEDEILKIMSIPPPFTMYAVNNNYSTAFHGLEQSYCAFSKGPHSGLAVDASMTRRGLGNLPKEQFHITGLNKSSQYTGYLALPNTANDPGRGGGTVWKGIPIDTKSDGNCQVIYNLPFCSEVAYAVPANPTRYTIGKLVEFYDEYAKSNFANFTYSLQQIACNASGDSRYSVIQSCDDCYNAYKTWLCAVTIPRCADYSSNFSYLAERDSDTNFFNFTTNTTVPTPPEIVARVNSTNYAAQRSRNPNIEQDLQPGPYKEIKPCLDLCYTLMQSCPSDFGFGCPHGWQAQQSYGDRSPDGDITCSFLGAAYFLSRAERTLEFGIWRLGLLVVLGWVLIWISSQ